MKCQTCGREFTDRGSLMLHASQMLCKSIDLVIEEKVENNFREKQSYETQSFATDATLEFGKSIIIKRIDSHLENLITEDTPVLEATVDHEGNLTFSDNIQYPPYGTTIENYETETIVDNTDEAGVCIENVHIGEDEADKTVYGGEPYDIEEIPTVRKRKRKEYEWAVSNRKKKRNSGEAYITRKKNIVKERQVKPTCKEGCRLKCTTKCTDDQRQEINRKFWDLADLRMQRTFLVNNTSKKTPSHHSKQIRSNNYKYLLLVNDKAVEVCKTFFLNTFGVSERYVYTAWNKLNETGIVRDEERGKHKNHATLPPDAVEYARQHIDSFPVVESHYLRSQTRRKYIDGQLTLAEMYRLYVKKCQVDQQDTILKESKYREIFNTQFNIGFFVPRKDQCATCHQYNNCTEDEKKNKEREYQQHRENVKLSRDERSKDVDCAKLTEAVKVCEYDLQAIIPLPSGDVSSFFYKRRLNTYNFTIFENVSKAGFCYIWDENRGKKGAIEVASCVYSYIQEHVDKRVKHLIFFSDNCSAQNKNKFLATMYNYILQNSQTLETITHKYLTVGHTQNSGDSMHSCIERQCKRSLKSSPIYTPAQFTGIVGAAKKTGVPYVVKELHYTDFCDFKKLSEGLNFTFNKEKKKVEWLRINVLMVDKSQSNVLFYKTSWKQEEFFKIHLKTDKSRGRKSYSTSKLHPMYASHPGISIEKKRDLMWLLKQNHIPKSHAQFYESLVINQKQKTFVIDPQEEEEEEFLFNLVN